MLKMGKEHNREQDENPAAFEEIERVLHEFQIKGAVLCDHTPVLRIRVSESQFAQALHVRETLVERIKPFGYRFIALDLDEL